MKIRVKKGGQLKLARQMMMKKKSPKKPVAPDSDDDSSGWEEEVEEKSPVVAAAAKKSKTKAPPTKEKTKTKAPPPKAEPSDEEEDDEDEEEDEDLSDDDNEEVGASTHKEGLSKLKESDPEFYKFLQKEDADLLEFDDSDGEGEEEDEDEEMGDEEEEEDGEPSRRKSKQPKIRKDKSGRNIFNGDQYLYLEDELEKDQPSAASVRLGVAAFTAAVARVGSDIEPPPWVIEDQQVFDALIRLCFRRLGECIMTLLGKPQVEEGADDEESPAKGMIRFAHWKKYNGIAKMYVHGLLLFLAEVQTPGVIVLTVKTMAGLAPLYVQFPKLARHLVKALARLWTRKTMECRCIAYIAMNALLRANGELFALLYKTCYMGFVSCSRDVTTESWPLLLFMHRSFAQLTLANPVIAYQYAFGYIRQMAIHIRNAVISNKRKDLVQSVYNWQLMQCLYLWTKVISLANTAADTEGLIELTYPLAQIIIATLKLFPSTRYLPLRVHCVTLLLQLQMNCDRFIPTLALSFDLLAEVVAIMRTKPKEAKVSTMAPDLTSALKSISTQMESPVWRKAAADEVFKVAVQSAHALSQHPAFPDVVLPLAHRLRVLTKACRSPEMATKLKSLQEKLREHSDWVRLTLAVRDVDVTDDLNVMSLKLALRDASSPMAVFHAHWIKYWKMKDALLSKEDPNMIKLGDRRPPVEEKKKAEKGAKKARKEESDDEEEIVVKKAPKLKKGITASVKADASVPDVMADLDEWSDDDE